jgi:hypothetical protein
MAQNLDLESSDFRDKNIQINTDGRNIQVQGNNSSNNMNQGSSGQGNFFQQQVNNKLK